MSTVDRPPDKPRFFSLLAEKLRSLFGLRPARDPALDEELTAHVNLVIDDYLAQGLTPEEARHRALREFGNRSLIREDASQAWRFARAELWVQDFSYSLRSLRRDPAFTLVAVFILALGIGGNTTMFSIIRGVLLKPLPYRDPARLVRLSMANPSDQIRDMGFSQMRFEYLRANARSFSSLGAFFISTEHFALTGAAAPEQVNTARVSANFLSVLGIQPLRGRAFASADDRPGASPVALISNSLWQRRFRADPLITSSSLNLNSTSYTIVGVLPPAFDFPIPGMDVWVTHPAEYSAIPSRFWPQLRVLIGVARLRPGVSIQQARAELQLLDRNYRRTHPDESQGAVLQAAPLGDHQVAPVRSLVWILFGAVGLVLLIACANVAGLLLGRAASRTHEFTVKAALGASPARLVRQLLAESAVLAACSALLGIAFAQGALLLVRQSPLIDLPRANEIRLDPIVLAFTLALSLLTGLTFGLVPALQASRPRLTSALHERASTGPLFAQRKTPFGLSLRSLLVAAQIALSVVLLIGAALLTRSFLNLEQVDPGFHPARLLTAEINLPTQLYPTPEKKTSFYDELLRRVRALPGVRAASVSLTLPGSPKYATGIQIVGQPAVTPVSQRPSAQLQSIVPGYFQTLGIPLKAGRAFSPRDRSGAGALLAMVNESFARRFLPSYSHGPSLLGQHVLIGDNQANALEIIGIAADVHESGLRTAPDPEIYLPTWLYPLQTGALIVDASADPRGLTPAIRRAVQSIDPGQPLAAVHTMDELLASSVRAQRVSLLLVSLLAGLALLLALVGIHGVLAYSVLQRSRELAVRRALGAQAGDILQLILQQGARLALAGIAAGSLAALALTRTLSSLLFQVKPTDPAAFLFIAALILLTALLATALPAWRATRIDPVRALR